MNDFWRALDRFGDSETCKRDEATFEQIAIEIAFEVDHSR